MAAFWQRTSVRDSAAGKKERCADTALVSASLAPEVWEASWNLPSFSGCGVHRFVGLGPCLTLSVACVSNEVCCAVVRVLKQCQYPMALEAALAPKGLSESS